jgi:gliding motility-associated-like protein
MLGVTGANIYEWSPSNTLDNSTAANPIARPTSTTEYRVTGKNIYGCTDTGSVTVKVEDLSEAVLIIPHAFTPNGDGKNECYRVHVKVPYASFELAIYDRWGKRAFLAEDPKQCWDGTYGGQPAQLGTYYYYMRIKTEACGEVFRKGDIHLIR